MDNKLVELSRLDAVTTFGGQNREAMVFAKAAINETLKEAKKQKEKIMLCLVGCYGKCDMSWQSLLDWDQHESGDESQWVQICRENCATECNKK